MKEKIYYGKRKDSEDYGFYLDSEKLETYVELTKEEHSKLFDDCYSQNKRIQPDENGYPVLVDPPAPSQEEMNRRRVAELETYLASTDWYAIRFADTGKEIPDEVKEKRQAAREELSTLKN